MKTIELDRNSLLLRFYSWLWEIDPKKANLCKLFWGIVLFPIGFLLKFVFFIVGITVTIVLFLHKQYRKVRPKKKKVKYELSDDDSESRGGRFLDFVSTWSVKLRMKKIGEYFFYILIFGWLGVLLVLYVIALVNNFVHVLVLSAASIGSATLLILFCVAADHWNWFPRLGKRIKGGFSLMYQGYKAVKTKTCPQVVVIDSEPDKVKL